MALIRLLTQAMQVRRRLQGSSNMATKLRTSMTVAVTAAGLLTGGVLLAQTRPAPAQPVAGAQTPQASAPKANGSYPIVVGQNAAEIKDDAARKAVFAGAEASIPDAGYKVLSVTLPAEVNKQLGIEGETTLTLPQGAENPRFDVTDNEMSLTWDESPEGEGDVGSGTVEMRKGCARGYHRSGKWCRSEKRLWWYSNNTAWFKGHNEYRYWYHDGNKKYNYWAIKRAGTCKSKGIWTMLSCGIGSKKRTRIYQRILDISPRQDTTGDCRSISLSVEAAGIGIGGDYQHCDESDINWPNRTHFSNYWRGLAHRKERAVQYQYILRTKQGERPRFTLWSPYVAR